MIPNNASEKESGEVMRHDRPRPTKRYMSSVENLLHTQIFANLHSKLLGRDCNLRLEYNTRFGCNLGNEAADSIPSSQQPGSLIYSLCNRNLEIVIVNNIGLIHWTLPRR